VNAERVNALMMFERAKPATLLVLASDYEKLEAQHAELLAALHRAADTFADLKKALKILGHPTTAATASLAEDGTRAAIAKAEGKS
jgi:hypothetical protein